MRQILLVLAIVLGAATTWAHDWNGIAIDARDHVFVVDAEDAQVWRIDPKGKVSVHLAGAKDDEPCPHTHHLAMDEAGVLWLPSG